MFDLRRPARLFDPVFLGKAGQEITEQIFVALSGADDYDKKYYFFIRQSLIPREMVKVQTFAKNIN
jgi:hypothetical protein